MRTSIIVLSLAVSACSSSGGHPAIDAQTSPECSKKSLAELQKEVRRTKAAFKPLNAAANRNPSEENIAAAAAAVADIVVAQANLDLAKEECRK